MPPTLPDKTHRLRWLRDLGPGLITGASDDDPSGIATYSQAGAQLGFALSWVMVVTYPLMAAIQEISARIGRTSGAGLADNIRRHYPPWILQTVVCLLCVANTINIGADLGAMGEAVGLLVGGPVLVYTLVFAALCATLQIIVPYARYVGALKWLALSLLGYFATLGMIKVPWGSVAHGLLVPTFTLDAKFWSTLVAVLGTTISPYMFFWQASQEVEEIAAVPEREALIGTPRQAASAFQRIRLDTLAGMAFSNLVALAIIITTAATVHASGVTNIETAAQAAASLRPLAGRFAELKPARQAALGVDIDQRDAASTGGEGDGELGRQRGLAGAAFLLGQGQDFAGHRESPISAKGGCMLCASRKRVILQCSIIAVLPSPTSSRRRLTRLPRPPR